MFRKMPFVLLAIIVLVALLGSWIPPFYQSIGYGLSLTVQSFIVFVLPILVFCLLFKTAVHFSSQASKIILAIVVAVCFSNLIATTLSYFIGSYVYTLDMAMQFPDETNALIPLWNISFPKWVANDRAMFSGMLLGIILGRFCPKFAKILSSKCDFIVNVLLRTLLLVIPFLVAGSIMKMSYDKVMGDILCNYWLIFTIIASSAFAYIGLIYCCVNYFQFRKVLVSMKNILPAAVAGFGSMSSAAAMPLTIIGTEKNTKNRELAGSIIPATVNIHMLGDCFAIPIFAFAVLKGFDLDAPTFSEYLIFVGFFVLAKFSSAGIPGGGVLVMMPVLEKYLGFDAQMLSFIMALYILFDPVITSANIYGNGGFAMVMDRIYSHFFSLKNKALPS